MIGQTAGIKCVVYPNRTKISSMIVDIGDIFKLPLRNQREVNDVLSRFDIEGYKELKSVDWCATPSSTNRRSKTMFDSVKRHNGVVVADVDALNSIKIAQTINKIRTDRKIFGFGKSLSGAGLHIFGKVTPIPKTCSEHDVGYETLVTYLKEAHGIVCDSAFKGKANSLIYFSRDDMRQFRSDAIPFEIEREKVVEVEIRKEINPLNLNEIDTFNEEWGLYAKHVLSHEEVVINDEMEVVTGYRNTAVVEFAKACKHMGVDLEVAMEWTWHFVERHVEDTYHWKKEAEMRIVKSIYYSPAIKFGGGITSHPSRNIFIGRPEPIKIGGSEYGNRV